MARCGCSGTVCSCTLIGGSGVAITGSGSPSNPYQIQVEPTVLQVGDTATVNMTLTGAGTPGAPYKITADSLVTGGGGAGDSAPIGSVTMWPTTVGPLPVGYLVCDGTVYNVVDYPVLGGLLGNLYGGDAVTTFGVPNFKDLMPIGAGTVAAVGVSGGSATISAAMLPPHNHTIAHTHDLDKLQFGPAGGTVQSVAMGAQNPTSDNEFMLSPTKGSNSANSGPGPGASAAHRPPFLAIHFIIKAV